MARSSVLGDYWCVVAMSSPLPLHTESLIERLPLVSYILRLEPPCRLVYVSPQVEATFGVSRSDFEADDEFWSRRIHEDDRERFLGALAGLEEKGGMEVEYRVLCGPGRTVWVRDVASVTDGHVHGYLVDVTREKELERELARERATLDAFFDRSSIGLAITDPEGRYLRVNDALARVVGPSREECLGERLADVAPDLAAVVDPVREAGETREFTVDLEREQATIHILVSYFPFEVDGRTHHGRVVVDLSEQHRAQAAERRYRHLIEHLPLVSYVNDVHPVRRASFVSPQILDLTGHPIDAFLGDLELADRIIHPDDLPAITERERAARAAGEPFEHEYRIVRKDGSVRWVLDRMETVCDADGEPLYEEGFLVDVTDRHDTASLLRAVWDGALDAMLIADDDGCLVDVNPAACRLFGRSRDELVGRGLGELTGTPDSRWDDFRGQGTAGGDAVIVRPDGEQRDVEVAARANVMPGRHLSVVRDVTGRKRLEADLWRAQKLESVGRLAGGVAHDFNNLLTAIRGYAQLLGARAVPGSVEHHHTAEIDRAVDRAAALTAQLLALGRRQTVNARPLTLSRLLEARRETLAELFGPTSELVFELDPELPPVEADPVLVAQAISTLVANGAEAVAAGGRVVVATRTEVVAARESLADGSYVVVTVTDDGQGFDAATLEHVFEPFFTTKEVGRGLSLASAYGTVRQSGGTITVDSRPGDGTTFSIYLPYAGTGGPSVMLPGHGETVLVVERDPAVRDVVFELLTDATYRVLSARTAAAAVETAEKHDGAIDLLLTDLDELREAALSSLLRGANPGLRTLSITKPYTAERLAAAVGSALESDDEGVGLTVMG
jgi:two-component system cell cycle sensor histidine kinase/response regulator CckA